MYIFLNIKKFLLKFLSIKQNPPFGACGLKAATGSSALCRHLLRYADALAFAPLADGIILVVEQGRTTREDLGRALQLLKDFPILGTVLNKVPEPPSRYYEEAAGRREENGRWWHRLRRRLSAA